MSRRGTKKKWNTERHGEETDSFFLRVFPPCSSVFLRFPLLLLLAFLAGCVPVRPVVKIGLVAPFEGRQRAIGYDAIYAARLAVREFNAAGYSYRVALVALDDRGDPDLATQTAAGLVVDADVVAVVGHFLPETTAAATGLYAEHGLALIPTGAPPFAPFDPASLPPDFRAAYEAVTPFDETAGPHAGPTYDAVGLLLAALAQAEQSGGGISRATVQEARVGLEYAGVTGMVYWP